MKYLIYITLSIISLSSCTKIIDIELNTAMQRIVIEAKITDQDKPAIVYLSRSTGYFNPEEPEKVSGAKVSLSSDSGESEVLSEISPGVYQTSQIQGSNGREYYLKVEDGEDIYEATSFLPTKVVIDSLEYEYSLIVTPHQTKEGYMLNCKFTDPASQTNYYTFNVVKTPIDSIAEHGFGPPGRSNSRILVNDVIFNGNQSVVNMNQGGLYQKGDTISVELISIDQNTYSYLDQLNEISGGGMMFSSSAPANPKNNLSNGAMGYFAAEAIDKQMVLIQ